MYSDDKADQQQDLSGVHLWLVLWKASRAVEANAQRSIARYGMVMSDFGVLEALLHRGPLSAKALGAKVLLTSGSVTAAIDRLAERGLVRRQNDAADRRACIVRLTAAGERLISRAFAQHRDEMESALAGFAPEQRRSLLPLLRRLGRAAESRLQMEEMEETHSLGQKTTRRTKHAGQRRSSE